MDSHPPVDRYFPPRQLALPGLLDTRVELVRGPHLLATFESFRVWPQGVEFELHLQTDPTIKTVDADGLSAVEFDLRHPRDADNLFELGVIDGDRRTSSASTATWLDRPDDELMLAPQGGGGGTDDQGGRWRISWWLTPLPTSDSVQFWCVWPSGGLVRSVADLDADVLRAAAARAVTTIE